MSTIFKLSQESVNNAFSVYEDSANEVAEALKAYQLSLEGVLGTGWKGKAAEKFTAIIEEYEKTTQSFIAEINKFGSVMKQCGGKYVTLENEGNKIGKDIEDEHGEALS